ncbi:hypothetical protein [Sulfitobacter sp.]|uniref:hypothetical protein n=1 Tax=Sulfitobacter sp. TaxID=1903071 RepID=UPI003003885A
MNTVKINIEVSGTYEVENGLVTVTAPNGISTTTQVGDSPAETIARMMLREIVDAALEKSPEGLE